MSVAGSVQLSSELGIYKKHRYNNRFKRRDALSFRLFDSVNCPVHSVPCRYNVVICRSFLPIRTSGIPIMKTAATALTRSCHAFHGNPPLVLKLVPALGVIVFTIWGLVPLMRQSRNLFLNKSDSSWRNSSTNHVTTSYIQPLLMWTGAILICRALDPIVLTSQASQAIKQRLLVFVRSLSTVLATACCLSSLIQQAQKFFMETNDSKDTRNMGFQFAGKALYSAVWVAAVSLFMELLGFSTQKWLTAGGLGTVLLTLAGREIFTNFLSSVMIHATRPFVLNEWIQTKIEGYEVSGTVEHVGWWSPTIIRGDDREAVHIPNHKFTVNVVRNLSQKTHWRIKTHLAISHLDVDKINIIVADMRKVLAYNPQVEQQRLHRRVFLENVNPENQALLILISCFVKTSHFEEYLCVKEAIILDLLRVISHHRARLATPIRTIQKAHSDADMENIPFFESVLSRAEASSIHPFLLIEPSYKINGDDKTKAQARSVRTNEEEGDKVIATVTESKEDEATTTQSDLESDTEPAETTLDSEADYKVIETPISESKEVMGKATKLKNQGMSESKGGNRVAAISSSDSSNPKIASQLPDSKDQRFSHSSSVKKIANKQSEKVSSVDARQNSRVGEAPLPKSASAPSYKSSFEGLDPTGLKSKDSSRHGASLKKTPVSDAEYDKSKGVPSAASHGKQDNERPSVSTPSVTSRSPLEDNLVLGVALEGSKRTLPIEDNDPSPTFAACGNGSGSLSAGKDKKDGQILTSLGDQRDHER